MLYADSWSAYLINSSSQAEIIPNLKCLAGSWVLYNSQDAPKVPACGKINCSIFTTWPKVKWSEVYTSSGDLSNFPSSVHSEWQPCPRGSIWEVFALPTAWLFSFYKNKLERSSIKLEISNMELQILSWNASETEWLTTGWCMYLFLPSWIGTESSLVHHVVYHSGQQGALRRFTNQARRK